MSYQNSVQQFAELLSKRAVETAPLWAGSRQPELSVSGDTISRFFLNAAMAAFHDVPSDVLITILTSKLRSDMRKSGFEPVRLQGEENDEIDQGPKPMTDRVCCLAAA